MRNALESTFLKHHNLLRNTKQTIAFPSTSPTHGEELSSSHSTSISNNCDNYVHFQEQEEVTEHVSRGLPNGDFYEGDWLSGRPHGTGKYLWIDGCMYEGEWRVGCANGRGKFSWPSGATYEGDFHNGSMNGFGTYTSSSGDTYWGSWSMDAKHGHGKMSFPGRDNYEGEWANDFQEGHGKYIWKNGNEYSGNWKAGAMNGQGAFVWENGNSYHGGWMDGLPNGHGKFYWPDGSFYVGYWDMEDGNLQQKGVFYKGTSDGSLPPRDPDDDISVGLQECEVCSGEVVSVLPSKKKLHWSRGRSKSVISFAGLQNEDEGDADWKEGEAGPIAPMMRWPPKAIKRQGQGETISKGHKNYELMLNLQLGIRHAARKGAGSSVLHMKASDFDPKEKVWTRFHPAGSKHTPPHQSCDFRWKDYCPMIFSMLKQLFKVGLPEYTASICKYALRELSSPGKSGSFFYFTEDDKYMIKTLKKSEVKVLLKMLPAYYNHVQTYENTLVTRFFGLHCVKLTGATQRKVRFVIMGNLFCSEFPIQRRFDLKGSSQGRTTDKPETQIDETTTLKDLDLNFIFRLQKSWFQEFCGQVDRDCHFLEQERIMDYSLLVGVHFKESSPGDDEKLSDGTPPLIRSSNSKLGINMPARVEKIMGRAGVESVLIGEQNGEFHDVILYCGIIDVLQDYDISKKLEHAYKSIHHDPTSISAVDPKMYAKRFRDFIFRVFTDNA